MKMPGSSARSFMADPVAEDRAAENGEDGSTAMTPRFGRRAASHQRGARTSVLLPLPGAPCATIWARPVWGYKLALALRPACPRLGPREPRARALVEPSRIWLASVCTPEIMALQPYYGDRRPRPRLQI